MQMTYQIHRLYIGLRDCVHEEEHSNAVWLFTNPETVVQARSEVKEAFEYYSATHSWASSLSRSLNPKLTGWAPGNLILCRELSVIHVHMRTMTETPTDHDLCRIFCLLRPSASDLVQSNAGLEPQAIQVFAAFPIVWLCQCDKISDFCAKARDVLCIPSFKGTRGRLLRIERGEFESRFRENPF